MVKNQNVKIVAPLFLLITIFLVSIFYIFNHEEKQDLRSRASEEDDAKYCVNPPECCARMEQSRDAHECEWPIRGYCNNCGVIEGRKERCGWYWIWHDKNDNEYKLGTNGEKGYGCMIGDSPSTMRPKYNKDGSLNIQPTAVPTVPIPPTIIPTTLPIPTSVPTEVPQPTSPPPPVLPTQVVEPPPARVQITYVPVVIPPYIPPTATPTTIPFRLNLPNILPPKEKVDSFFTTVKTNLLDFFSKILP